MPIRHRWSFFDTSAIFQRSWFLSFLLRFIFQMCACVLALVQVIRWATVWSTMSWPISGLSTVGSGLLLNCLFHDKYERTLQGNLVEHTWILWGQVDMAPTTTSRWHISPRFPRLGLRLCVIVVNMAVSTSMKNFMKKFHTCTKNEDHGYGYIATLISQGELWAFVFVIVYTLHSGVPRQ